MKTTEIRRPLMAIALTLCAGIITGRFFALVHLIFPAAAMLCAGPAILLTGRKNRALATILTVSAAFLLGIALIHLTYFTVPDIHIAASPPKGEIAVVGRITEPLLKTSSGWRFILNAAGIETDRDHVEHVSGSVQINLSDSAPDPDRLAQLRYGTWVRIETTLSPVSGYCNIGGFDSRAAMAGKGVLLTGNVSYTEFITVLQPGPRRHPMALLHALRAHLIQLLNENSVPPQADLLARLDVSPEEIRTLSRALLLGDRTELNESVKLNFQEAGLMHLLAISGLHIGIIAWLFNSLMRLFPAGIRVRSLTVVFLITLYGILTGASPSVMRAVLIIDLYMIGKCLHRSVDLLNILGTAALILMLTNPPTVFNISFQLTFLATLGIVLLMKPMEQLISWIPNRWTRQVIAVSLAAQFATAPLTAVKFHRIGGWSFLPYMLLIPVITGALMFGIAGLCLGSVPVIGTILLHLHGWCVAVLAAAAEIMASLPGATVRVITPGIMTLCLALAALAALALRSRHRSIAWVWVPALVLTIISYTQYNGRFHSQELSICFLDVGNADATLITLPSGDHLLVDAGGIFDSDFDVGRYVVAPVLRTLGVRNLRVAATTHPHPDHHLGMFTILREFPVGEMWVPSRISKNPNHKKLLDLAQNRKIPIREMDISPDVNTLKLDANNRSLVLGIEYGKFRCLLPGDAEHEAESGLLSYGSMLNSEVLKAGHHGSRTSSSQAFLNQITPDVIVIPCGRNNRFGHPHRTTITTMENLTPAPVILRSDRAGMVRIRTDGRTYSLESLCSGI